MQLIENQYRIFGNQVYDEEAYFEKISWRFKREYVRLWADKQIDS